MLHNSSLILGLLAASISLVALFIVIYNKRKHSASFIMAAILQPYIRDEVKNIIIPDGIGGLLEIEHLMLLDQGLFLVETYPMSGNLFGAETIDQWTQIVDGRSYKFANPLRHIWISKQAVKALAPKIPIFCRIVFNANSVFPKGKPAEVSVLSSLADDMDALQNEPVLLESSQKAWELIMRIARKNGQAVKREGDSDG